MKQLLIGFAVLLVFAIIGGCEKEPASQPTATTQPVAQRILSPEAQAVFDRLNAQCASEPWQGEIDMIERPETCPENRAISGEMSAFVSDCKDRLARQGVRVKWNPEKKLYELEKTQ
ncbi:MAG: hypothetical protein QGH60_22115 [Phycisphaerae bacterium]|jgi:hypothetical protein|nr:hypothetical protein [Phycisphaerae bacterium]